MGLEKGRDVARPNRELLIEIKERDTQPAGERSADGRLARASWTHESNHAGSSTARTHAIVRTSTSAMADGRTRSSAGRWSNSDRRDAFRKNQRANGGER